MSERGFFFDLTDQLENNSNIHRQLLQKIEATTGRNLICYLANASHPAGAMQDHDPDFLENLLRSIDLDRYGRKLDVLVNSPGGFPYAAGKMVKVCRTFSTEFRAIVLGRALSAATLLCLGARELLMSETASLGPTDPQMLMRSPKGDRLVPAHVIIQSFGEMLGAAQKAIAAGQPPDPFFHVLDSLDVTAVFESSKALSSTNVIAKDLLKDGLLRATPERIDTAVKALITEGEKELHGKHLYPDILQNQIGLPVSVLKVGSDADLKLRELFVRAEAYLNNKGIAKYFLSSAGGLDINVQLRRA
ncbi:MAG: hypothetical protein FJ387_24280 [Verrucomicrobia bacterium]|nr:hypothetical protein [Verrucomicrobiota bacterium]